MKRLAFLFFAFVLMLGIFLVPNASFAANGNAASGHQKAAQLRVLDKLQKRTPGKQMKLFWDQEREIPGYISGKFSNHPVQSKKAVKAFLNNNRSLFKLNAGTFKVKKVKKDNLGMTHYRTQLMVDGIPVYGSEWIVHTNQKGYIVSMNGQLEPQLAHVKWLKRIKRSKGQAIKDAKEALNFTPKDNTFTNTPRAKLYLYQQKKHWMPAYRVVLQFLKPYPGRMITFVNAENGKVVDSYNAVETATGSGVGVLGDKKSLNTTYSNGTYYLIDQTKPMSGDIETYSTGNSTYLPGNYVTDSDNNFNSKSEAPAVDAHYYAGVVYDYYHDTFGRNSYDNNGSSIISTVHYGQNYNNAFWNGSQMVYGDGDGTTFIPLSGQLDVVAHELTHAVTGSTAGLQYHDQPGALNESMSDVFGTIIEAYNGDPNWLMGEDVYTPNNPNDALRSLKDPTKYGQPDNMADYVYTSSDNGGVHTNSGIPNKAFYNIASQMGLDKSAKIYYRALTQYLTPTSDFMDARNALLQSAADLYGSSSTEYNTVADGFAAVGIGSSSNPNPGTDTYEPNDSMSSAYGPIDSGQTYNSYISTSSDVDFYKFNTSQGGTLTVDLSNLPGDYDLYLLDANGSQVDQSINGGTSSEEISYSASGAGTFYVEVVAYNGASSTSTAYALTADYPTGTSQTAQWYYLSASADTPHPYPSYYDGSHQYTQTGAQKVAIHYSIFDTESGYDFVYIKDQNGNVVNQYSGYDPDGFWVVVDGDQITSELVSDAYVNYYGYHIDEVAYYNDGPLSVNSALSKGLSKTQQGISISGQPKTTFKDPIKKE